MTGLTTVVEVLVSAFLFFVYVLLMLQIVVDLFRDRTLSGGAKALWILALLAFPFLAALVYIVTRGRAMAERSQLAREPTYPAGVDEIVRAKTLLDQGVIDHDEFIMLKRRALAHVAR